MKKAVLRKLREMEMATQEIKEEVKPVEVVEEKPKKETKKKKSGK